MRVSYFFFLGSNEEAWHQHSPPRPFDTVHCVWCVYASDLYGSGKHSAPLLLNLDACQQFDGACLFVIRVLQSSGHLPAGLEIVATSVFFFF